MKIQWLGFWEQKRTLLIMIIVNITLWFANPISQKNQLCKWSKNWEFVSMRLLKK